MRGDEVAVKIASRSGSEKRSLLMARVRRSGTAPELALRRALHRAGYRYRLNSGNSLPGTPDIVLRRFRLAIFVDGCFWHGCPLHGSLPKTNTAFWTAKIIRNQGRDKQVDESLKELGWKVLRVWEHEVQTDTPPVVRRIRRLLRS
jgi:DNA mismatch endonuclease (patch repair protein)